MKLAPKTSATIMTLGLLLTPIAGCENKSQTGAVAGGAAGAGAGALIARNNQPMGALIGGALGAGGGYLIGAQADKNNQAHKEEALHANQQAEAHPATAADVQNSFTADLNKDGFVTLDEVVAMKDAGLSDREMIDRLHATNDVFALSASQEQFLRDRGVSQTVITAMTTMNRPGAHTAADTSNPDQVISQPPRY